MSGQAGVMMLGGCVCRGASEEDSAALTTATPGAPVGAQAALSGSGIKATQTAAGQTGGLQQSPAILEVQISKVRGSNAASLAGCHQTLSVVPVVPVVWCSHLQAGALPSR